MFDLVNDIEAYPQYMDGCIGAKILHRDDSSLTARLDLEKAGIRQSFTTKNLLKPAESMTMELVEGPFKRLQGVWLFKSLANNNCQIEFQLEFEFSNFLLGLAAGKLMSHLAKDQVDAVCRRARTLYGP